jgi:hypothetical protein
MKVSAEQKKLFSKNAKVLLKKFPALSMYIDVNLPQNVELYDGDDELDIVINGNRFYGTDARAYAAQQVESYLINPSLLEGFPPEPDKEKTPTHLTLHNKLNKAFQRKGIVAHLERLRIDSSTTFVFGIGLGYHLYPVIAHTRCRDLVIIEPEPIFLLISMYFTDWKEILDTLKDRLSIIVTKEPDAAFSMMRSHIHHKNPGVLQSIFHFVHYRSGYMDAIHKVFLEKNYVFFDGLGFYDDEKLMTKNSILNMYMDNWSFCGDTMMPIKGSAVIVGAGPSLNNDLDWLKEHQNELVIFSGGSSLQTLLKNGITPDFHAEIENIPLNYDLLAPLVEEYDLSNTVLVCSSTMDTRSARLFNKRIWFMREGVTASSVFGPTLPTLSWQNPTVVNTAVAAATRLGFRNILLLGADFGTKDPKVHHSKDTSYETHEDLKKVDFKFPDKVSGNFGGSVYTNIHMMNGMTTLKHLMAGCRGVVAFNGSDGAKIDRLTPIRSHRYKIIPIGQSKSDLADKIYAASRVINWGSDLGISLFDDLRRDFSEFISSARKIFATQSRKNKDFILFLSKIYERLDQITGVLLRFTPMITGSMTTQTVIMMYWWRRIPAEDLPAFETLCRRQWSIFLDVIEKDFLKFLDEVRQELPLVRPELFDDKGNLIIETESSAQNAE